HRGAFGGADLLDLLIDIDADTASVELDVPPRRRGINRDDLHRLVELCTESGRQVGIPADHRVHRITQPVLVKSTGDGDVQLHRIYIVVVALRGAGVKKQSLLQWGQRKHVS